MDVLIYPCLTNNPAAVSAKSRFLLSTCSLSATLIAIPPQIIKITAVRYANNLILFIHFVKGFCCTIYIARCKYSLIIKESADDKTGRPH
jgi:hypothetical protein